MTNNQQGKPRILLADDHTLVAEGLSRLLEKDFDLVVKVEDGRAAVEAAEEYQPDIAILDISMPRLNGFDAAKQIKAKFPNMHVIFLTMHGDPQYVRKAMRVGASGFLLKRSAVAEVKKALEEVFAGRVYITPAAEKWMPAHNEKQGEILTSRQREVLQLIAEGLSAKEIAYVLNISVKTAEFHKSAIMEKLNLHSTADLTKYALKHGIVFTE